MTTLNQLLTLIEMSGMKGDDEIALRVGEAIVPMESCTFHEMNGKTALMFQGGRNGPAQETGREHLLPDHPPAPPCICTPIERGRRTHPECPQHGYLLACTCREGYPRCAAAVHRDSTSNR